MHVPRLQRSPLPQAVPGLPTPLAPQPAVAPQNLLFEAGLTQPPLQLICVPGHETAHVPEAQIGRCRRWFPGFRASLAPQPGVAPQNWLFEVGSTQPPLQLICEPGHETAHVPVAQTMPLPQVVPGLPASPAPQPAVAPQNWLFEAGSTQVPLQLICEPGHRDHARSCAAGHAVAAGGSGAPCATGAAADGCAAEPVVRGGVDAAAVAVDLRAWARDRACSCPADHAVRADSSRAPCATGAAAGGRAAEPVVRGGVNAAAIAIDLRAWARDPAGSRRADRALAAGGSGASGVASAAAGGCAAELVVRGRVDARAVAADLRAWARHHARSCAAGHAVAADRARATGAAGAAAGGCAAELVVPGRVDAAAVAVDLGAGARDRAGACSADHAAAAGGSRASGVAGAAAEGRAAELVVRGRVDAAAVAVDLGAGARDRAGARSADHAVATGGSRASGVEGAAAEGRAAELVVGNGVDAASVAIDLRAGARDRADSGGADLYRSRSRCRGYQRRRLRSRASRRKTRCWRWGRRSLRCS